jgi:hypothetical protein
VDQVAALQEAILQRSRALKPLGKKVLLCFLDIQAAYNTVDSRMLWDLLKDEVDSALLRTLRALFDCNTFSLLVQGYCPPVIEHEMRLLQDFILSPILYARFIDELPRRLELKAGWNMGDTPVTAFMYADDVALIADDANYLVAMLQTCDSVAFHLGFRFASPKCKIVAQPETHLGNCRLHGEALALTSSFTYLSVPINIDGIDRKTHVQRLAGRAIASARLFKFMGFNGFTHTAALCKQIYTTFIRPQLEYALAIIKTPASLAQYFESAQHAALCMLRSVG